MSVIEITKDNFEAEVVEAEGKVHAYLPSEAAMIWDEWFALFNKDADGNLYYMNEKVDL